MNSQIILNRVPGKHFFLKYFHNDVLAACTFWGSCGVQNESYFQNLSIDGATWQAFLEHYLQKRSHPPFSMSDNWSYPT